MVTFTSFWPVKNSPLLVLATTTMFCVVASRMRVWASALPDSGVKWLYVQADPFWNDGAAWSGLAATGRITESNELNNVFGPVTINVQEFMVYLPIIQKR